MIFTPETSNDIDELILFVNGAYRGESAEADWASESKIVSGQRIDAAMLAEMIAVERAVILLMRNDKDSPLAGCVSYKPTEEVSTWYLSLLAIDPQRQTEGLGRQLLSEAEDRMRGSGATRSRISVIWVRRSLLEWYERRGYQLTGKTEPFPYADQRFGIPLLQDLYFIELEKPL